MDKELIFPMEEKYQEYLIDESKYQGQAESISFPENEKEVVTITLLMHQKNKEITIQGGKTGIVGGAVPNQGHIMNLSAMNHCKEGILCEDGTGLLTVEPGINLIDLKKEIGRIFKKTPLIWPPQPTETSSTVGGIAATNALGINAFLYGDSRKYIQGVRLVQSDGTVKKINREDNAELLDTLLGMEGIAGVFSELTLKLLPKPESAWGISFFFESDQDIGNFIQKLKISPLSSENAAIAAIEYLDRDTINLIERKKNTMTKLKELPDVETQFVGMIYFELQGSEEGIEELAESLMELSMDCNSDPDKAWALSGEAEIGKMKAFRHAAAETTNLFIEGVRREDNRITKLGTDMSLEDSDFLEVITSYKNDLQSNGLKGCVFGHVGDNHLHVNILPSNYEEYQKGIALIKLWAAKTKKQGGRIICEHGIGKLKRELLGDLLSQDEISAIKKKKQELDSINLWNRGNILPR